MVGIWDVHCYYRAMQIGYIGLGKMGKGMVLRLLEKGHSVVAWNRSIEPRVEVQTAGATTTETVEELVQKLSTPRLVWLMLPSYAEPSDGRPSSPTEEMFQKVLPLLNAGDILIDGANSFYKDSKRRGELCQEKGIHFMDVGVSGGPSGARTGACLMIGGERSVYEKLVPLFESTAAEGAYQFFDGYGAGHFVKMVHNGIEYGMMQAIAEGFEVMKKSDYDLNLLDVARIYQNRSVVESRLVGWAESGLKEYGQDLESLTSTVAHTGEGEWTVKTAEEIGVKVPIIKGSFDFRVHSANNPSYTGKFLSMLRNQFGGHEATDKIGY